MVTMKKKRRVRRTRKPGLAQDDILGLTILVGGALAIWYLWPKPVQAMPVRPPVPTIPPKKGEPILFQSLSTIPSQLAPRVTSPTMENVTPFPPGTNRTSRNYIQWVQTGLNFILNSNLVVDGISGSRTKEAIRQYQSLIGLPADGIVGPITEQALMSDIAEIQKRLGVLTVYEGEWY